MRHASLLSAVALVVPVMPVISDMTGFNVAYWPATTVTGVAPPWLDALPDQIVGWAPAGSRKATS